MVLLFTFTTDAFVIPAEGNTGMIGLGTALSGITTPVVTPFDGETVDWTSYETLLTHLVDGGVDAVFPCGTTGEFASLTADEKRQLVERTVAATPADVSVVVGGTGTNVDEAVNWIETTADIGADGVVVTAPYFHTSNSPQGLSRFFERVADRSPLSLVLYNIPACVGEEIPVETVAELATHDSIVGLKDSSGDLAYGLRAIHQTPDEFGLFQGYDPLVLPSLRMGFDGGVNALSNVFPNAYRTVYDDPESERAREIHREVIEPLFDICREEGFAPATKAALAERGVLPSRDVRPPLVPAEGEAIRAAMDRAEAVLP